LIASHIKPIVAESEHSQSRYSFFEVVHSLYSSDIGIRDLLSILIGGPEKGFGGHSFKPSTKSYKK